VAMAFFSGISGSKLADVAAVGGILMPAVRRTKQNPNEAAGLLAASAIMAETIPPCINMIILGFVANLSIGGLFLAGIVPAEVMAAGLAAMATMSGMVMFIVAAASGVAHGLTMEQVPHALADIMVKLAAQYGSWMFMLISILALIFFGAILEGAAALIIFGPLLTPIAIKLGYHPLHFAVVLVIAMGIGLFSPPFGLGMYATCAIGQVRLQDVVKPYLKYLSILLVALLLIAAFPEISLWLPRRFGLA